MNEEGLSEAVEQQDGRWPQIDSTVSVQPCQLRHTTPTLSGVPRSRSGSPLLGGAA